ncbi:MAG: DUF5320 domain-containing protein [Phycisphaerae bacterium]
MPRGDRTGPAGMGPMTGRAAGFCAGYPVPGFMNPVGGRGYWGWGRGFGGRGRGWRHRFYATGLPGWARAPWGYPAWGSAAEPYPFYPGPVAPTATPEQELAGLKEQAQYFQNALDEICKRMEQLEVESKE